MLHTMGLNPEALTLIKNQTKTIEMRLFDEARQRLKIGDEILFINTQDPQSQLQVVIQNIYHYTDFDALYREFDKIKLGYLADEEAHPTDMEHYYPQHKIKQYGVVGIEIATISSR